jgi:hypothetical protein
MQCILTARNVENGRSLVLAVTHTDAGMFRNLLAADIKFVLRETEQVSLMPGWATLSPLATSGKLAMKVWRHRQHFCNSSDTRIIKFHIKFSNLFSIEQICFISSV